MKRALFVIAVVTSPACKQGSPPPSATPVRAQGSAGAARLADAAVDAGVVIDAAAPIVAPPDAGDPAAHLYELAPAMVSRDGKLALLAIVDHDSARAAPNLMLEVHDRNDHTVASVLVSTIDESLDNKPDAATLAKRVAAADKLIKAHDFVPLETLARAADRDGQFSGAEVTVDWDKEHFAVTVHGKRVIDRAVPKAWRGGSHFDKLADLTCSNPDFLRDVYVAADARLAVVEVAYRGNDTCWEPGAQLHVVTW